MRQYGCNKQIIMKHIQKHNSSPKKLHVQHGKLQFKSLYKYTGFPSSLKFLDRPWPFHTWFPLPGELSFKKEITCEVKILKTFSVSASQLSCCICVGLFLIGKNTVSPNTLTCLTLRLWSTPFSTSCIHLQSTSGIGQLIQPVCSLSTFICKGDDCHGNVDV